MNENAPISINPNEEEELSSSKIIIAYLENGQFFDYFEEDYKDTLRQAYADYREIARLEFIQKSPEDSIIPIEVFDKEFEAKQQRWNALLNYQYLSKQLESFFVKAEFTNFSESDYEKYSKAYLTLIHREFFNENGFEELLGTHAYIEQLFSNGVFTEKGRQLLQKVLADCQIIFGKLNKQIFGVSDDFVGYMQNLIALLTALEEKDWKFTQQELKFLEKCCQRLTVPQELSKNMQNVFKMIQDAIQNQKIEGILNSGLLSSKDLNQIETARRIIKESKEQNGFISIVNKEKLQEISSYLRTVLQYKAELLTREECSMLEGFIAKLKSLLNKKNRFGFSERPEMTAYFSKNLERVAQQKFNNTIRTLKTACAGSPDPTRIFDEFIIGQKVSEETVYVNESLRKEEAFLRRIKYIAKSSSYNRLQLDVPKFFSLLSGLYKNLIDCNYEELLKAMTKIETSSSEKFEDFFLNDLERNLLIKYAFIYKNISEDEDFESKIQQQHLAFENEKAKFKRMIAELYSVFKIFKALNTRVHLNVEKCDWLFAIYQIVKHDL
jgi:hypothetical protein